MEDKTISVDQSNIAPAVRGGTPSLEESYQSQVAKHVRDGTPPLEESYSEVGKHVRYDTPSLEVTRKEERVRQTRTSPAAGSSGLDLSVNSLGELDESAILGGHPTDATFGLPSFLDASHVAGNPLPQTSVNARRASSPAVLGTSQQSAALLGQPTLARLQEAENPHGLPLELSALETERGADAMNETSPENKPAPSRLQRLKSYFLDNKAATLGSTALYGTLSAGLITTVLYEGFGGLAQEFVSQFILTVGKELAIFLAAVPILATLAIVGFSAAYHLFRTDAAGRGEAPAADKFANPAPNPGLMHGDQLAVRADHHLAAEPTTATTPDTDANQSVVESRNNISAAAA